MIAPEFMTFLKSSKERRLGVRPTGTWSGRGFSTGDIAAATRSRGSFCIDKTHTRNIKQVVIPNQLAVRISGESLLRKEVGEVAISTNENSKVSSLEITLQGMMYIFNQRFFGFVLQWTPAINLAVVFAISIRIDLAYSSSFSIGSVAGSNRKK